jgi:hypothetical protein
MLRIASAAQGNATQQNKDASQNITGRRPLKKFI